MSLRESWCKILAERMDAPIVKLISVVFEQ